MGLRLISSLIRIFLLSRLADIETTMMPSTRQDPQNYYVPGCSRVETGSYPGHPASVP